jgi:hypothetical protein
LLLSCLVSPFISEDGSDTFFRIINGFLQNGTAIRFRERNGCCERVNYDHIGESKSGVASCDVAETSKLFKEFLRHHNNNRCKILYTELTGSCSKIMIFILQLSGSNLLPDSDFDDYHVVLLKLSGQITGQ